MQNSILVIHPRRPVADAVVAALDRNGFQGTAAQTLDEALDSLCTRGHADLIFYEGSRPEVAWAFRRAQDANPALLDTLLIALSPLKSPQRRSPNGIVPESIDVAALLLIVRQFCRRTPPPQRSASRYW